MILFVKIYKNKNLQFCNTFPPALLQLLEVTLEIMFSQRLNFIRHILFDLFRIFKLSPLQSIFVFRNEKVLVQLYLEIKEVTEAV